MKKIDKIILASASPRRAELLRPICDELVINPLNVEEKYGATTPEEIVKQLSIVKLGDLPNVYRDTLVVASDTIVWYDGKIYGKPKTAERATSMLKELSSHTHSVYTGYSVAYRGEIVTGYDKCDIIFKQLSDGDISEYVATGSPLDKAGAYGVQDGVVVESFEGDINTIIGLPVDKVIKVCEELKKKWQ